MVGSAGGVVDADVLGDFAGGLGEEAHHAVGYLLCDTLKVTGSESVGLVPASLGRFFVNEADPTGGGTGHAIRVCEA